MNPQVPSSRAMCLEGVRAARDLFEREGCIVQEVAQQNDFGKDAYVDLTDAARVTHLCVAVQIKAGTSYRTSSGDYFVPLETHATNWRNSTVPVFGLVYDPTDCVIHWVDLTAYLREHLDQHTGAVPISKDAVLNPGSLRGTFRTAVGRYAESSGGAIALGLFSRIDSLQDSAVYDAWALGRHDARYLLLLRRLLVELRPPATRRAVLLLSHCVPHPDILWTKENWIPQPIVREVQPTFRWSPYEIAHMVSAVDVSDWGRGTLGQCIDVLLYEDPQAKSAIRAGVGILLREGSIELAVRAATLALTRARNQADELAFLRHEFPTLDEHEWFTDIAASIDEPGRLSLY